MKVGFIGAGKVGCSLYDYFVHNNILVTGCYTRTQANVSGTEKQTQKIFTTSIDKILTKREQPTFPAPMNPTFIHVSPAFLRVMF